jgi:hypothetical protein
MRSFLKSFPVILMLFFFGGRISASSGFPNDNVIYKENIATVLLHKEGFEMSSPVILLNSPDRLRLSFDDLSQGLSRYKYTFLHCEADWTTSSDITEQDYIEGFREADISNFDYSYNTTKPYTHFWAVFPNNEIRLKISGNYILKVYIDDPENVAFTMRFMVAESTPAGVTGTVHQASAIASRLTKQEVDFRIHLNGMPVSDAGQEIRVVVTQNDRWDNALRGLRPRFMSGGELDYDYDEENTFDGGNEFRAFDTKSLVYQSERIRRITYDSAGNEVYLLDDLKRGTKNYVSDKDINGRRLIKNEDHAQNSETEADYTWVHFFLPSDPLLFSGKVYLLGALTYWRLDNNSLMKYNPLKRGYEKNLLLKQGYYNYLYVVKDARNARSDDAAIEGNHWETENEYTVFVYYHPAGGLYDRLIAVQNLSSMP